MIGLMELAKPDQPPHAPDAERAALGSMMQTTKDGRTAMALARSQVEGSYFYVPAHRIIFDALCAMEDENSPIDHVTLSQWLADNNKLVQAGDRAYLIELSNFVPTAAAIEYYLDTIRDKYILRQGIAAAREIERRAYEPQSEPQILLDTLEARAASLRSLHGRNGSRLSFRSPSEILSMPRNPAANYLGDRLLGIGLSLVIAGIGGIGKSRLFLQLLVAFILERIWCGIETHHTKGKPWMLIQTQNPIPRLQDDLEPLKKYAGSDWPLVEKNLIIHTLETDRDLLLHLSDPKNASDTESAIRDYDPIGVAFDPLNEIAVGDLNKDQDMMATCCEIGRISRAGNPKRAILVATHALTGLAGMKKAFGFEAAGFGRNSKVLQFWSRASINIVPGNEDYSVLILSCAKNNNGKMFSPFAVRLNPETMIYQVDETFDVEGFRELLHSTQNTRQPLSPKIIAEIEWPNKELDKKQLVAAVREETGCSNATAYRLINNAVGRHIRFNKRTKIYAKK